MKHAPRVHAGAVGSSSAMLRFSQCFRSSGSSRFRLQFRLWSRGARWQLVVHQDQAQATV